MSFSSLPGGSNDAIKPFTIHTDPEILDELETLLKLSRVAVPTFENSQKGGKLGIDRQRLQSIKEKWIDFDWSKTEDRLNNFPHFKAAVTDDDGTKHDIHFVALFSKKADAVPLIMLHGWPGSFLEFMPILQLLKDKFTPETLPYHVIVPSLPGYAFSSGPPVHMDFGYGDVARILDRLMSMLGFGDAYIAQGGDIGSGVARILAATYSGCKAVHVNFLLVPKQPPNTSIDDLTPSEKQGLARAKEWYTFGTAYAFEHGTKTSTIGLVLASNPIALMAWIGEKFDEWSDVTPLDETIIEFVTLYWITSSIERCLFTYRQDFSEGIAPLLFALDDRDPTSQPAAQPSNTTQRPRGYTEKPLGFSSFPKEGPPPRSWVATQGNLVFYEEHDKGGHFAALEQPELLLKDMEDFVAQVWQK